MPATHIEAASTGVARAAIIQVSILDKVMLGLTDLKFVV